MAVVGDHQQAPWWATLLAAVASVAAPLAALDPQLTPHWAALVRLVVPVAASSAVLDPQQAPDEAAPLVAFEPGA